ncbi:MAG: DNA mismatch repair endonuclease MutL, partial [Muribaculaceae bacterium]
MNCDIIKLLPDSVANQIAAGEVIQRPASVVKELVENSVDAGATAIEIIIKDGGRTLIQVVDNGKGMSPTDARMAFERHATSKITSAQDLYSLHTMGFRGEALPSIAAVSQIDLRTMQPDQAGGTRLQLSESKFVSQEPCACRPGTNIMVKNLFFNLPARRKFLKSDKVEKGAIIQEFTRLALVNTAIDFTFVYDGKTEKQLVHGSLKQRIIDLIGKSVGSNLLPIATETELARIDGFVGTPESAIKTKPHQFFFVNGRNMRHPYFAKAVTSCYEEIIRSENQPNFFINISVDPAAIDVNVHPQKHEIKFAQEQAIWQMINAAVRQALGRVNAAGAIDFDPDAITDIPTFAPDVNVDMPSISTDDSYDPF